MKFIVKSVVNGNLKVVDHNGTTSVAAANMKVISTTKDQYIIHSTTESVIN